MTGKFPPQIHLCMQCGLLLESAYFEIKKTMLGRRVLRARTLPGITQEIYALLTLYQVLRIAIADATIAAPGTDPDRASFTIALQAAREQVIQAANVIAGETIDLAGTIGRHILDNLLPARLAARQPPGRQTATVPLRLQEPARGPAHLPGDHQHRHLDDPAQPLTTRP